MSCGGNAIAVPGSCGAVAGDKGGVEAGGVEAAIWPPEGDSTPLRTGTTPLAPKSSCAHALRWQPSWAQVHALAPPRGHAVNGRRLCGRHL